MKLQKILSNFQKLHPKEIDLSLDRIKNLCEKLGNPQDKIKAISVVGTNGKNSTIQAAYAILKEANIKCNVYTSPHIQKINERFVFNNHELNDDELADLFEKVENINDNQNITVFEMLTACFFYKAAQYPDNINLVETGLFHRFDACNILKNGNAEFNLMHCVSSYPVRDEDANLKRIDWLKTLHDNIGYSDHTQSTIVPALAIMNGATVIEKHFTIDKELPGRDNKFALDQNEFAIMSNNIACACQSIIDKGIEYQDIESDTVNNYRGRWEPQDYKD